MSIARATMHEFINEEDIEKTQIRYDSVGNELFPAAKEVINIQSGPTSLISIAVYPSFEDAAGNLEGRKKMMKYLDPFLKDGFFQEGEIIYHYVKPLDRKTTNMVRPNFITMVAFIYVYESLDFYADRL